MIALRPLRQQAGLTQVQVAKALGVVRTAVSMWETTDTYPRCEMIPALATLLGCTIDDLFQEGKNA